jgi:hypothetical protein
MSMPALGLGDLLFSVQQRAAIDVARENGVIEAGVIDVKTSVLKMNGFYFNNHDKRKDATVWVNGKLTGDKSVVSGGQLRQVNERDKTVSMSLDKTGSSITLKAGQTLHLDTGELSDSFEE